MKVYDPTGNELGFEEEADGNDGVGSALSASGLRRQKDQSLSIIPFLVLLFQPDSQANNQGHHHCGDNEADEAYPPPPPSAADISVLRHLPQSVTFWTGRIPETILGRRSIKTRPGKVIDDNPSSTEGKVKICLVRTGCQVSIFDDDG